MPFRAGVARKWEKCGETSDFYINIMLVRYKFVSEELINTEQTGYVTIGYLKKYADQVDQSLVYL